MVGGAVDSDKDCTADRRRCYRRCEQPFRSGIGTSRRRHVHGRCVKEQLVGGFRCGIGSIGILHVIHSQRNRLIRCSGPNTTGFKTVIIGKEIEPERINPMKVALVLIAILGQEMDEGTQEPARRAHIHCNLRRIHATENRRTVGVARMNSHIPRRDILNIVGLQPSGGISRLRNSWRHVGPKNIEWADKIDPPNTGLPRADCQIGRVVTAGTQRLGTSKLLS